MLRQVLWITVAATSVAACKWTDFDDLADKTWVQSQGKPAVNSTDYGLQLLQVQHSGDGGKIAVIGANEPSFSTLVYNTKGDTVLGPSPVDLNKQFTINSIPESPALLSDPETDAVALVIPSTEGRTVVLSGLADTLTELTVADAKPNTATFVSSGTPGTASTLLLTGTGTFHGIDIENKASTCKTDDDLGAPLQALAIAVSGTNVFAWTESGKLLSYDLATVQGTCDGTMVVDATPTAPAVDTGFKPGVRSRMVPIGDHYMLLAGIDPSEGKDGMVGIMDLTSGMFTNEPATFPGLRSFAIGTIGGVTYVALGFPARAVQNVAAGQVEVHEVDMTAFVLKDTIALTLNDAQPEANQSFGRAVEIMHYNDDAIFVIAGDNEIYSYFETQLFDNARK